MIKKTIPYSHQLESINFSVKNNGRVAFLHSIGVGKSLVGLYSAAEGGANKVLVVCPSSVRKTWHDEVKKHTDWKFLSLEGTASNRKQLLNRKANVYCINYEGLKYLFGTKRNNRFMPLCNVPVFDAVIFDESQHLSNYRALQTQIASFLARKAKYCYLLSGTPINGTEMQLWSQYWILDGGKTLGRNFFVFRNRYFDCYRHSGYRKHWVEWKIKSNGREQILDAISPITLRFDRKNCLSLPPLIYEKRYVALSKEQKNIINALKGEIVSEIDPALKQGISRLGIYKAIKLAQVPGGTIITSDNSIKIFNPNPKLDELVDLLAQIDEKVVIFHAFTEEGRIIEQVCEEHGWNFCSLRAEVTDKAKEIETFQEDKNCRIMIAHPSSGGEGLNLQVANIAIFYSLGFIGHLRRDQAEGRIYRAGQNKKCTIIDLIAEDSMDEHLLTVQQEKRDVTEAILRFFER